jgi:hypothetical protein
MEDIYVLFSVNNANNLVFSSFSITMSRMPYTLATPISTTMATFSSSMYPVNLTQFPWLSTCQAVTGYMFNEGIYGTYDA